MVLYFAKIFVVDILMITLAPVTFKDLIMVQLKHYFPYLEWKSKIIHNTLFLQI